LQHFLVGKMERYDTKWILNSSAAANCDDGSTSPATLGLKNMAGTFTLFQQLY